MIVLSCFIHIISKHLGNLGPEISETSRSKLRKCVTLQCCCAQGFTRQQRAAHTVTHETLLFCSWKFQISDSHRDRSQVPGPRSILTDKSHPYALCDKAFTHVQERAGPAGPEFPLPCSALQQSNLSIGRPWKFLSLSKCFTNQKKLGEIPQLCASVDSSSPGFPRTGWPRDDWGMLHRLI